MMGGGLSFEESQQRLAPQLFQLVQSSQMLPDIGIDQSILNFSGLDSVSALESHSAQLLDDLSGKGPAFLNDLGSALSAFGSIPAAVGLGALVISFILDLTISGLMRTQNNGDTLDVVRRVFGEEKASGVRDTVDEYVKRFRLNMNHPEELLEDTKRMEAQLSNELTRLRNSMLQDNQMSSRSMKHWVNGAAFHMLMLVHVARMKMERSPESEVDLDRQVVSISSMAEHYGNDLQNLLAKYETYKRATIYTIDRPRRFARGPSGRFAGLANKSQFCGIYDSELGRSAKSNTFADGLTKVARSICGHMTEPYLNYMFTNWKVLGELRGYFPGVKQNLKEKIMQNSEFNIQKFLPERSKIKN